MAVVISDANVLIDLDEAELLPAFFSLPDRFAVPDVLFYEELADQHPSLPEMGLLLLSLSGDSVLESVRLVGLYAKPSRIDLLALALAKQEGSPLVTGDRRLREAANAEGVTVHGTLWVMERLVSAGRVTVEEAESAYRRMREAGSRLPWDEVEAQLTEWRRRERGAR